MEERKITLSPSVICADMCNLERDIRQMESLGMTSLHVDLIDGHFSPSMPLGLAVIEQLRQKSRMDFDVHIMATDNELFVQELIRIGVQSVTVHVEAAFHLERLLALVRSARLKAGVALNPATPLHVLDYVANRCDYILLMLISPGYAGHKGETMVPYALDKVRDCRTYLDERGSRAEIVVDGRVSLDRISGLVAAGADVLVAGSTSLFSKPRTMAENYRLIQQSIQAGLKGRR